MAPFQRTTLPAHYRDPDYTTGRPSDYRPEYCDAVIEAMGEGCSLTAFAGIIGVARDTVYEWIKSHREFSDAVSRARPKQVLWWERKLQRSRKGAETAAAMFALKNVSPTDWRDVRTTQHQHSIVAATLTDAQLYAIASGKHPGDASVVDAEFERVNERNATS